jgi:hypothetical protein
MATMSETQQQLMRGLEWVVAIALEGGLHWGASSEGEGGWGFEGQAEWRETSRMREVEEEEKEEAERVAEEEDERRAAAPMGVQGVRSVGAKAR